MSVAPREPIDDGQFLLSTAAPDQRQVRISAATVVVLLAAAAAVSPVAAEPLSYTGVMLPAYAAALLVTELITAVLLFSLFSVERSPAMLVLAGGYLFLALLVAPWLLSFPGVAGPSPLLDAGMQGAAAFAALRRIGLPLFVLVYAALSAARPEPVPGRRAAGAILTAVLADLAVVGGLTWLIVYADVPLPTMMLDSQQAGAFWHVVPPTALVLCAAALPLLWFRRRSLLDLWLIVVLVACVIEALLLAYIGGGRFSVGWWAGRVFGLVAASVVLLVLLSETTNLHARLSRAIAAERRAREARLTAMETLSASIAHEINQPVASMVTNADAGLRWLGDEALNVGEARSALERIVEGGHRAGAIVASVRAMFRRGGPEHGPLDINDLIADVLRRCQGETRLNSIEVRTALAPALPPVIGYAMQLQQVVSNLVANAIDAMCPVTGRPRVLTVATGLDGPHGLCVSVADNGSGLAAQDRKRIFEPFFTTKAEGMGMGLLFCRSVVESHGGRLWIEDNAVHGVTVRFTLPIDEADRPAETR